MNGRFLRAAAPLWLALSLAARAQQSSDEQVTIDELRSPTSPAFTILEIAPTNVVRPNTPRELALEVLSASERSAGEFPSDLALELAPYWLGNHSDLTFADYYNPTGIGQTIVRSLSMSIASSELPNEAIDGTTLGLGVRFHLVPGHAAPDLDAKVQMLKNAQLALGECIPDIGEAPPPNCDLEGLEAGVRAAGDAVRLADMQRTGWVVEAAFAASRDYPSAQGSDSHARQVGAWLTGSYRIRDPSALTFLTAIRFLEDRTGVDSVGMLDVGGRLIWEAAQMPVSLSLEFMHRDIDEGENSTSVLGTLEYPINSTLTLVASYGKGLATPTADSDVTATISVNFGFGKGPSVPFDKLTAP